MTPYKAREILTSAINGGKVVRPDACERCRTECRPHGHHDDYSKPLEVDWLCRPCHDALHSEENQAPPVSLNNWKPGTPLPEYWRKRFR